MELEACARVVVLFRAGNEGPQSPKSVESAYYRFHI